MNVFLKSFARGQFLLVAGLLTGGVGLCEGASQVPAWWTNQNVINTSAAADYAPANQGQAKWLATNACSQLLYYLPGDANSNVLHVVTNFTQTGNYLPVSVGQLKALARPFYDRIQTFAADQPSVTNALPVGMTGYYPWTAATNDDADYAIANIGQMKYAFSFNFDRSNSGIPDWWEWQYFGTTGLANTNLDPQGNTLLYDYQHGINPTNSVAGRLGYWPFDDTNFWAGAQGQLPLSYTNIAGVPSWSTNAVVIDSSNAAKLVYRDVESSGSANINCQQGSVRFWFWPDWNSGDGTQSNGRLIEMGNQNTNGWWSLLLNTNRTQIQFVTQTNSVFATNLTAPINWSSNIWHQVVLTYSLTNSLLYLDGQGVVTNGLGVTSYPAAAVRAKGFSIGSDWNGINQARGRFDELETFNYPLNASDVSSNYQAAINLDSDGDGISNIQESELGTDPYTYNSPNGLSGTVSLILFTPLK